MNKPSIILLFHFVIIITLLPPFKLFADNKIGIKTGINIANYHGESANNFGFKSRVGICAGVFSTFEINDIFAIQPELLYSSKGAKMELYYSEESDYVSSDIIDYLVVPVVMKITIPSNINLSFSGIGGTSLAVKLNSKAKTKFLGEEYEDDIDEFRRIDWGAVFGAGLNWKLGKRALLFEFRYNLGLIRIQKEKRRHSPEYYNKVIQLLVGYAF